MDTSTTTIDHAAILRRVRERVGHAALARRLGITRQAVQCWIRVPAEHALEVEAATGLDRADLRPDIYPRQAA